MQVTQINVGLLVLCLESCVLCKDSSAELFPIFGVLYRDGLPEEKRCVPSTIESFADHHGKEKIPLASFFKGGAASFPCTTITNFPIQKPSIHPTLKWR